MHAEVHTRATEPGTSPKPVSAPLQAEDGPAAARTDAGALAHDLRNVLSSVRAYAQLLLSLAKNERMLEYLSIIESESGRCCRHIEHMLMSADQADDHPTTADSHRAEP